jgi:hypothetical protein
LLLVACAVFVPETGPRARFRKEAVAEPAAIDA